MRLLCGVIAFSASCVHSYRRYLNYAPNSDLVPCPIIDGKPAAGCHGASICEAWGHVSCYAKAGGGADDGGGDDGPATTAGTSLQAAIDTGGWNVDSCSVDSDGDGLTDGDELGDGCCAWNYGDVPFAKTDVSNPSYASSVTSRPSCTNAGLPPTPTNVAVSPGQQGGVLVTWTGPPAAQACVCEYRVTVVVGSSAPVVLGARDTALHLCGVGQSGAAVAVTVAALNRAGISPPSPAAHGALSSSPGAGLPSCSVLNSSPYYIDTAGTGGKGRTVPAPPMAYGGVLPMVIVGTLVALLGTVVTHTADPNSVLRSAFVHKHMWVPAGDKAKPGQATGAVTAADAGPVPSKGSPPSSGSFSFLSVVSSYIIGDLGEASYGYTLSLLALIIALVGCAAAAALYFNWMVFPLGTKAAVGRGIGYAMAASMGFQLLPAARFSVFLPIFGVSFERSLKLHRWAGMATLVLGIAHAALIIVTFDGSQYGWRYCLLWLPRDGVNPLAGFLAGVCILVLTLLAWEPIRRKAYELFLLGHMLWPVAFVLGWLHVKDSDTGVLPLFLPPLALCLLDFFVLAVDMVWARETVLVDAGVIYSDGRLASCSTVQAGTAAGLDGTTLMSNPGTPATPGQAGPEPLAAPGQASEPLVAFLVLDKLTAGFGWAFRYHPGQFVYLCLPRISVMPHPVSISSVADPAYPGRFTVHLKSMGKGTWSEAVVRAVHQAISMRTQDLSGSNVSAVGTGGGATPLVQGTATPAVTPGPDGATPIATPLVNGAGQLGVKPSAGPTTTSHGAVPASLAGMPTVPAKRPVGEDSGSVSPGRQGLDWPVPKSGTRLPPPVAHASEAQIARLPVPQTYRSILKPLVAGPFGLPSVQLARYSHFVLVAGGIGITPIAPLHYSLLHGLPLGHPNGPLGDLVQSLARYMGCGKKSDGEAAASHTGQDASMVASLKSLTTVWAVREAGLVSCFTPLLALPAGVNEVVTDVPSTPGPARPGQAMATGRAPTVDLRVYTGSRSGPVQAGAKGGLPMSEGAIASSLALPTQTGRPDVEAILQAAARTAVQQEASSTGGAHPARVSIAVVVCGPGDLVRSVLATAQALSGVCPPGAAHGTTVRFHVHRETFLL